MKKQWIVLFASVFIYQANAQVQKTQVSSDVSESAKIESSNRFQQPHNRRVLLELTGTRLNYESVGGYSKMTSTGLMTKVSYGLSDNFSVGVGTELAKTEYNYDFGYESSRSEDSGASDPTIYGQYRSNVSENMATVVFLNPTISVGNRYCSKDARFCNRLDGGSSLTSGIAIESRGANVTGIYVSGTARDLRRTDNENRNPETQTGSNYVAAGTYSEIALSMVKLGGELMYQHIGTGHTTSIYGTNHSSSYFDIGTLSVWALFNAKTNFEIKPSVNYLRPLGTGNDSEFDRVMFGLSGIIGI